MKSVRHWTPTYILARIREIGYQRRNPDLPWLTQGANEFLSTYIRPSDVGLEFGSGRSTLWFAARVSRLVSVEHDRDWHKRISASLADKAFGHVDYRYLAGDVNDPVAMEGAVQEITSQFNTGHFDFVLIDGVYRDICTREALRIIRPGGILIVDNVNRHLPSNSVSPGSRSLEMGPDGETWREIAEKIRTWRYVWTSSGVTDTAIFFKPENA